MPLSSYTEVELNQLRELTMQSLDHYTKLINDSAMMESLKDGDRMALQLCYGQSKAEIDSIDEAIESKKLKPITLDSK